MSWLNLNESLNNLKGQISSFASGVLADEPENDSNSCNETPNANHKVQELQNLCASKDVEIASLRRTTAELYEKLSNTTKIKNECSNTNGTNEDHWFWDPPSSENANTPKDKRSLQDNNAANTTISDLTDRIQQLETEKKDLVQSLEQLDADCQRTTDKLVALKDELQSDYNSLKKEYDVVMKENMQLSQLVKKFRSESTDNGDSDQLNVKQSEIETLQKQIDELQEHTSNLESLKTNHNVLLTENEDLKLQIVNGKLQKEIDEEKYNDLLAENQKLTENLQEHKSNLDKMKEDNLILQQEVEKLMKREKPKKQLMDNEAHSNLSDDHKKLQDMYNELNLKFEATERDKNLLHERYVNILTTTVKKYVDYEMPDEAFYKPDENIQLAEFTCKVEIILKLLLDFKWKTETLEKKLCEISHEKTIAITEKNHEIEKLLHNSEILSQEVITKTQTIKDYETECSELIKNNDLLISELQQYKNSNALQTISETNEDNVLMLEMQLENTNKRIRELELVISDLENNKQDVVLETQTELDYIKKQVNMTGEELSQSKKEYRDLFKQYQVLRKELETTKVQKHQFETSLENTDYRLSETTVEMNSVIEELDKLTNSHDNLQQSYDNSQSKNNALLSELSSLKLQAQEIRHKFEVKIDKLNERLQHSKLTETEHKLQNDTYKKELETLMENMAKLEISYCTLKKDSETMNCALDELVNCDTKDLMIIDKINLLKQQIVELNNVTIEDGELRKENNGLAEDKLSLVKQLEESKKLNNELQEESNQLKKKLNEFTDTKTSLEKQILELNHIRDHSKMEKSDLMELKKENSSLIEDNLSLRTQLGELKNQFNETLNELAAVKITLETQIRKTTEIEETVLVKLKEENNGLIEDKLHIVAQFEELKKIHSDLQLQYKLLVDKSNILENAKTSLESKIKDMETFMNEIKLEEKQFVELKRERDDSIDRIEEMKKVTDALQSRNKTHEDELKQLKNNNDELVKRFEEMKNAEISVQSANLDELNTLNTELQSKISQLESEINNLNISKTELVNLVTVKHQENVKYHTEIQRLNQIIANETKTEDSELDRMREQNDFLKEKCEKLAQNLLEEQSNTQKIIVERQEKENNLTKELERLRIHLYEIENSYTQELLLAEQKNQEMQSKVNEVEQRERDSSTIITSVSVRANQQVETLQNQLQMVTVQRDELQRKISEAEDKANKQFAALTNLQCVLEQFQKEKERDIILETNRIRRQINEEKLKQDELRSEVTVLKSQLEESKQGLKAASRLTEQLDKAKQQASDMKTEVAKCREHLAKTEEKCNLLSSQSDVKVDKLLIKNLIVGLFSSNYNLNKDQLQVLKIIATVLDFNQQDIEKVKLNKPQADSWLSAILHPQALNANVNMSQQSLSEAFVRFLENESQPKALPTLLDLPQSSSATNKTPGSRKNSLLMGDVMLPTFADFAQSRNSSSILKDVLKENN